MSGRLKMKCARLAVGYAKMTTDWHQTCQQGCSGVGTRGNDVPTPFYTIVTLLEHLDFSFQLYV